MRICRYDNNRIGLVRDGAIFDVTAVVDDLPVSTYPLPSGDLLIASLDRLRPRIEELAASATPQRVEDVHLLSPVANPGKIIGAPVNYQLHVEEALADAQIHNNKPVLTIAEAGLFLKANSALVGPAAGIEIPRTDKRVDHELELALIIGKRGRDIMEADALDYVAGYAIGLDMTVRGSEERSLRKSLDSFAVLGPWLVTADEFGDPGNVDFELRIGGETRQKANTRDLIYDCRRLISYASQFYTLEPGDIIMTGTPAGVGPVADGDSLHCRIDGVGEMIVAVRSR